LPSPVDLPPGCAFHPRCPAAIERCRTVRPELGPLRNGRLVACHVAALEEGLAGA
jgi:peptide/nickel transport system ATP-binding protein